jgi:hypothetical protein
LNDYIVSLIRTVVPVGVGAGLAWLARETGIVLDEETGAMATVVAVALCIGAYYALARAVEQRWPGLGRVLVALGAGSAPAYAPKAMRGRAEPSART